MQAVEVHVVDPEVEFNARTKRTYFQKIQNLDSKVEQPKTFKTHAALNRFWLNFWEEADREFFQPIPATHFRLRSTQYLAPVSPLGQLISKVMQAMLLREELFRRCVSLDLEEYLLLRKISYPTEEFRRVFAKDFVLALRRARFGLAARQSPLVQRFEELSRLSALNEFRRRQLIFLARVDNATRPCGLSAAEQSLFRYYLVHEKYKHHLRHWMRSITKAELCATTVRVWQEGAEGGENAVEVAAHYPFYAAVRKEAWRLVQAGNERCHVCQGSPAAKLLVCNQLPEQVQGRGAAVKNLRHQLNKRESPARLSCRRRFCLNCAKSALKDYSPKEVFLCPYCRGVCACDGCRDEKQLKWIAEKLEELSEEPFFLAKFDFSLGRVLRFAQCYYSHSRGLRVFSNRHFFAFHLRDVKENCPEFLERFGRIEAANYLLVVAAEDRQRATQIKRLLDIL